MNIGKTVLGRDMLQVKSVVEMLFIDSKTEVRNRYVMRQYKKAKI